MKSYELKIQGMSCGHCVQHVKKALEAVDGLEVEDVQIGRAFVRYDDDNARNALIKNVEEAGYKVVSIQ